MQKFVMIEMTPEAFISFVAKTKSEVLSKSMLSEYLNTDLNKSMVSVQDRIDGITPICVNYDNDLKSVFYAIDISKAKAGVYADTPLNRKLGRVGQPYGLDGDDKTETDSDGNKKDVSKINRDKNFFEAMERLKRAFVGAGFFNFDDNSIDDDNKKELVKRGYASVDKSGSKLVPTGKKIDVEAEKEISSEDSSGGGAVYMGGKILPNVVVTALTFLEKNGVSRERVKQIHDEMVSSLTEARKNKK